MTTATPDSSATVVTTRGGRYGKQLASHLGRRLETTWDDGAATGQVRFDQGTCDLSAGAEALEMQIVLTPGLDPAETTAQLDRMEDVIGRHLVRFGVRDELVATWLRADGTPGTTQRGAGDD